MKCNICNKNKAHAKNLCPKCYAKVIYRVKAHKITWNNAVDAVKYPKPKEKCKCGRIAKTRGMCNLCYANQYNHKKIHTKKYARRNDAYLLGFAASEKYVEDTRTYEEWLSDRYDEELVRAINHWKKTGRIIDTCQ